MPSCLPSTETITAWILTGVPRQDDAIIMGNLRRCCKTLHDASICVNLKSDDFRWQRLLSLVTQGVPRHKNNKPHDETAWEPGEKNHRCFHQLHSGVTALRVFRKGRVQSHLCCSSHPIRRINTVWNVVSIEGHVKRGVWSVKPFWGFLW